MIPPVARLTHTLKLLTRCLLLLAVAAHSAAGQRARPAAKPNPEADRLVAEAERLRDEGKKESLEEAVKKSLAAAAIYRAAGDGAGESSALNMAGFSYQLLGEPRTALQHFERALAAAGAQADRAQQAAILNNMGFVHLGLGESQKALDLFSRALPILKSVGDVGAQSVMLSNIGGLYFQLGEERKALDYFEQSLALNRAAPDYSPAGEAIALTNLGDIHFALGDERKALEHYERALPLFRKAGDLRGEAATLRQIGQVLAGRANDDDLKAAVDNYLRAMTLSREAGDRGGEAATFSLAASAFQRDHDYKQAVEFYGLALPLYRAVGDRAAEARTLFNMAFSQSEGGDLEGALARAEESLALIESLRSEIGSQSLRSSYFASVQDYYEFYVALLMKLHALKPAAGFDARALQASERARARSLLETLAEAGADIRAGVDPTLLGRERDLRRRLNALGHSQSKLLAGPHTPAQAEAAARAIDALAAESQQIEAQIRQASPRYASLTQPRPLSAAEIQQQVLDPDTLLLEYSLGRDRGYLWAVTPDSIKSYELPKREVVEAAARRVHELLSNVGRWPSANAGGLFAGASGGAGAPAVPAELAELSRMLLAPVAAELGGKRLVVVADGALQYVPFAALPLPSSAPAAYSPLVTEHEIVSLPSASTLAVLRRETGGRPPALKAIAIFADPVFSAKDERLAAGSQGARSQTAPADDEARGLAPDIRRAAADFGRFWPRLTGTRREAEQILALAPEGGRLSLFDFAANRAAVVGADLGAYRYVHFATHGLLNTNHPELSGLLLSLYDERGAPLDGFLRAHEVFNLRLSADLVTLSACQTGLGKEIRGEGLVSLTRGFMYAGSPRVVVSLWSVNDAGTAELMSRFYREMLAGGKRPAAALRAAQLSMLQGRRFAPPFYWSAFTLQGEWR
jgi:CHAT domain-containing protein